MEDDHAQTFTGQQRVAAKYQDEDWTEKVSLDTAWRIEVDRKLQTIINLLSHGVPAALQTSQTVAGENFQPYSVRLNLITTQLYAISMEKHFLRRGQ